MPFIDPKSILQAIDRLGYVHPFLGITFLACKRAELPVGRPQVFAMDAETDAFLREFHRLDPSSEALFQPFKSSDREKKWVRNDYSQKGLQAINTQTFAAAFLHKKGSRLWAWSPRYVTALKGHLKGKRKIPLVEMATWLYRERSFPEGTTDNQLSERFITDFRISAPEISALFDASTTGRTLKLQANKVTWPDLKADVTPPPDANPDRDGVLIGLSTVNIGPAQKADLEPGARLTLITGDNGLGKTFLLDTLWWALAGTWAGLPSYPTEKGARAQIAFTLKAEGGSPDKRLSTYDWKSLRWSDPSPGSTSPTLSVFARVDGSFSVWDPQTNSPNGKGRRPLSAREVWDGADGRTEGLIRDWVRWQTSEDQSRFAVFSEVLRRLSPDDLGEMRPGRTVRIPGDPRDIPTIRHPYGEIPVVFTSAGVKRILGLAYLIVWAWHEHLGAAQMAQSTPLRRMVVLVDEIEAHLHPRWQRSLLPVMMDLCQVLSPTLSGQFILATHSPLVMASAESVFSSERDRLFHLHLQESGEVSLLRQEFLRYGDVSSWLTSPVFELKHARSASAERAIENAKRLQLAARTNPEEVKAATEALQGTLGPDDRFWPRWVAFAEKYGIKM